jgi:nitroimidazol reductase NimA-like FMN-containing flavoprotein (pyridoxamine 5'-phosphate oxidase superfamily)
MSQQPTTHLAAEARDVLDRIRYVVLGTIDEDGRSRTSPVYFVAHEYTDLYWVSDPASHHSHNLARLRGKVGRRLLAHAVSLLR